MRQSGFRLWTLLGIVFVSSVAVSAEPIVAIGNQSTCFASPEGVECRGIGPRIDSLLRDSAAEEIKGLALGARHGCIALESEVRCMNSDVAGSTMSSRTFVVASVRSIAAGGFHNCLIDGDRVVRCWGHNRYGQLGAGDRTDREDPVAVDGIEGIAVSAGLIHSCAATTSGAVKCWGDNSYGQLGDGSEDGSNTPSTVSALSGVTSVSAGLYHTCALDAEGKVHCWGHNKFGQLGDGTTTDSALPVEVTGLSGRVIEIAAGGSFSCGRLEGGTIECWGWNDQGELGDASRTGPEVVGRFHVSRTPVSVAGLNHATGIALGWGHACATTGDGIRCWGRNEAGQLGDGTFENRVAPVSTTLSAAVPKAPVPDSSSRKGIDVSYHSGPVQWNELRKEGYGFAFTLATAGVDFRDPLLDMHWEGMKRAGMLRGAYHYFVADDDPVEQAEWFVLNAPLEPGDFAPVIDIETLGKDPPDDLHHRLTVFADKLEAEYGVKPIIYTGPTFWKAHGSATFSTYPLWIAHYDVAEPEVPDTWHGWTLWQWKGDASLSSVRNADLDRLADDVAIDELIIPRRRAR